MKKTILLISMIAVIAALGVFTLTRQGPRPDPDIEALREQIENKQRQLEQLRAVNQRLEEQQNELLRHVPSSAAPHTNMLPPAASAQTAEPQKESGGFGKFLSNMMSDPETRKFIRDQQFQMMDSLYGPLFKQMGLTAEQTEKLKTMLLDSQMKAAEKAAQLFSDGAGTNRQELASALKSDQQAAEEELKKLLGPERFAQFQEYQQTAAERMQLNLYKVQTAGTAGALTDQQSEQLLGFMREEKQGLAGVLGDSFASGGDAANLEAMLSPEQVDKLLQGQELLHQRVYQRASTVLSPEQLEAFGRWQANQLQMFRMGMNMARKMFGQEPANAPSTPR